METGFRQQVLLQVRHLPRPPIPRALLQVHHHHLLHLHHLQDHHIPAHQAILPLLPLHRLHLVHSMEDYFSKELTLLLEFAVIVTALLAVVRSVWIILQFTSELF